jgi:hypothetical protein
MVKYINLSKNKKDIFFILIFNLIFFIFQYIFLKIFIGYDFLWISFTGFIVFLINGYILICCWYKYEGKISFLEFSEPILKFFLLILFVISSIIPYSRVNQTIEIWSELPFLSLFKGIITIFAIIYLPGACIHNIFFPKNEIPRMLKIKNFYYKITIYPLLSLSFIGIVVLLADRLNFSSNFIGLLLFVSIILFFLADLILEKRRNVAINYSIKRISISKFLILNVIFCLGIVLIAFGVIFNQNYLPLDDSWVGYSPAVFIGDTSINTISDRIYYRDYPIFWGYIASGLNIMSGLPLINLGTLLFPLCYIFFISVFLLNKAILRNFRDLYSVLSTFFFVIFSGFLIGDIPPPKMIMECQYYFIYKSFSYYLFFTATAIFIVLINNYRSTKNRNKMRYLVLSSFLITLSGITYIIPIIIFFLFNLVYIIHSQYSSGYQRYKIFSNLIIYSIFFFIIFDILMDFLLVKIFFIRLFYFIPNEVTEIFLYKTISITISYSFLIIAAPILHSKRFYKIIKKTFKIKLRIRNSKWLRILKNTRRIILITFILLLSITFTLSIFQVDFPDIPLFLSVLSKNMYNLGIIGLIGFYFSPLWYHEKLKLFKILFFWIIVSFFLANILYFRLFISDFFSLIKSIPDDSLFFANYWFNRIWFYSIIPMSLISSIGLIEYFQNLKGKKKYSNNRIQFIKCFFFVIIILFSYSGLVQFSTYVADRNYKMTKDEIKTIGWISENIPYNSNILIQDEKWSIMQGIRTISRCRYYEIDAFFNKNQNDSTYIEKIEILASKNILYAVFYETYLNQDSNLSIFISSYLIPNYFNETVYSQESIKIYHVSS